MSEQIMEVMDVARKYWADLTARNRAKAVQEVVAATRESFGGSLFPAEVRRRFESLGCDFEAGREFISHVRAWRSELALTCPEFEQLTAWLPHLFPEVCTPAVPGIPNGRRLNRTSVDSRLAGARTDSPASGGLNYVLSYASPNEYSSPDFLEEMAYLALAVSEPDVCAACIFKTDAAVWKAGAHEACDCGRMVNGRLRAGHYDGMRVVHENCPMCATSTGRSPAFTDTFGLFMNHKYPIATCNHRVCFGGPTPHYVRTADQSVGCEHHCRDHCSPMGRCSSCMRHTRVQGDPSTAEYVRACSRSRRQGRSLHCEYCCNCEACPVPLGSHSFTLHKFAPGLKDAKRNKLRRLLGTEIEICSVNDYTREMQVAFAKWKPHPTTDGSLPEGGFELPTQPAGGDLWLDMVKDITDALKTGGCDVDEHAGLHVHVDTGDLNAWDLRRVLSLYVHVEPALFDLVHPSRRVSNYSKPAASMLNDLLSGVKTLAPKVSKRKPPKPSRLTSLELPSKFYGVEVRETMRDWLNPNTGRYERKPHVVVDGVWKLKTPSTTAKARQQALKVTTEHKYNDRRYYALNLHSFWHRGTLEFRHHHGTVNGETITNWGLLCGSIVEWGAKHSDAALIDLLNSCTPTEALVKVGEESTGMAGLKDWAIARRQKISRIPAGQTSFTGDV